MEKNHGESRPRRSAQAVLLATAVVGGGLALYYLGLLPGLEFPGNAQAETSHFQLDEIPFNGARAYKYLKRLCDVGPRPSGSPGMTEQQELLEKHFVELGALVHRQEFHARHPVDGSAVPMTNLIVQWRPERKQRILLCAHYDTLPYPMLDPVNKRGIFVGANDGGSGVALLMEFGHEMPELLENDQTHFGVDFVMLDGEEFIFSTRHRYFLGSEYFARQYAAGRLPFEGRYRWGVLFDMIGDAQLQLPQERNSLSWRDTRPLVEEIWATARRLGVREFVSRRGQAIRDDHLPLHNLGGIPICDVIDFDYPPWHTQDDTPDKCSALSLAKVGWVIREWLKAATGNPPRRR